MTTNTRADLLNLMQATLLDRGHWIYSFYRPLSVPSSWHRGQTVHADCSKAVQYLCYWGHAPDPMGNGWASWGNSSTICMHLQHLAHPRELEVGDVVTFGWFGNKHAAMVIEAGEDPLLWSMGHPGAPDTYRLSQDRRPAQYLRLPVAPYKPTPEQHLRAETTWFAWAAWRLGEGEWRKYGKQNKRVRPDVARIPPPSWWVRLAAFLAARKRGH